MSIGTYPPHDTTLTIPLSIANGGTGATTAATARTNLGLGTLAQQDAANVAITGGSALNLGAVGVLQPTPSYPLDVNGQARVQQEMGLGRLPIAGYSLATIAPVLVGNRLGVNSLPDTYALAIGGETYLAGIMGVRTPPEAAFAVTVAYLKASLSGMQFRPTDNDTGPFSAIAFFNVANALVGNIATTATATAYNTASDARLKHAVEALTGALDVVQALRPVKFLWNADGSPGEGFLAHQMMRHVPQAVTGEPDAVNEDGSVKPQQVDHSKIVPWLTACCQELAAQVQTLQMEVAALKGALP